MRAPPLTLLELAEAPGFRLGLGSVETLGLELKLADGLALAVGLALTVVLGLTVVLELTVGVELVGAADPPQPASTRLHAAVT